MTRFCRTQVALVLTAVAALAASAAAAAPAAPTGPATRPVSFKEKYAPISDHNIFLKDRRLAQRDSGRFGPGGGGGGPGGERERPVPEASFILTGVVIEEGQLRAYVEDSSAGKVLRLSVGDAVARGHIGEIEIDAVAYAGPGQPVWISLGCDFRGTPVATMGGGGGGRTSAGYSGSATTTSPSGGSTAAATPGAPVDPNNPNLSIEEKMRLRRAQELQK
jgi:hypothetical protein